MAANLLRVAFEDYWATDNAQPISRKQMQDAMRCLDASYSQADLDTIFNAIDQNRNGTIEYEEFIEFAFSDEQGPSRLPSSDLDQLQRLVEGSVSDDAADFERILQESAAQAAADARRNEEKMKMDDERAIQLALEASASETTVEAARKRRAEQENEDAERRLLEASAMEARSEAARRAKAHAAAEEDELASALRESEATVAEERERLRRQHEEEDSSDLFRAALRASCLDLGPRGISQAAKVFATGDATIGQPRAGFDLTTSGAKSSKAKASGGAAPAYSGSETVSTAPVATRVDSQVALKQRSDLASRTSGFSAPRRDDAGTSGGKGRLGRASSSAALASIGNEIAGTATAVARSNSSAALKRNGRPGSRVL
eukprot:gnl/MRDRNA2_/MRDRNA2_36296_c0_seq1.p1 gnl/MRDRNA2_/MRDRNA2_36296_c0~~gnl/MRDRNA2_/MRDRNA2_36296_c0_seq1.p1  ORF type:complete len:397 (-),score=90.64 gnl/MRDRNA2_/MRDRNA2_36296_c0_seq1:82-1203(-)